MNTDLNNEEYPRLTPPEVVYDNKAALKKTTVIPLYAKITAIAASVALLLGIFWHRSAMPEQELIAELKPIEAQGVVSNNVMVLAESQAHFIVPKKPVKPSPARSENTSEKKELPLLAALQPITAPTLVAADPQADMSLAYNVSSTYPDIPYNVIFSPTLNNENFASDLSLIGRGIYKMTDGECESFADVFSEGLQSFKGELTAFATTLQSSRSQLRQRVH